MAYLLLLQPRNAIDCEFAKKLQNSYEKSKAGARTGDLRFISLTPSQLSHGRILDEEEVLQ